MRGMLEKERGITWKKNLASVVGIKKHVGCLIEQGSRTGQWQRKSEAFAHIFIYVQFAKAEVIQDDT
jgi:hypothetical protein